MWFKNAYIFKFTNKFDQSAESLEKALSENTFTPCGSTEQSHTGWVSPLGKLSTSLSHSVNGSTLISLKKEERIIPPSVIKDLVDEKIEALEAESARSATKKEKEQFKEDVVFELLPRAFSRYSIVSGYINADENIIVIDTATRSKAEDFLACLRKALGTLPVTSLSTERSPDEIFTGWLDETPIEEPFVLGMSAKFEALGDDGAEFQCKNQDLKGDEVKRLLESDMYVTAINLEWDEAASFKIESDLSLKQIKFFDVLTEQNDDVNDDPLAKLDADFALMAGEINRLINNLSTTLGFSLSEND